MPTQTKASTQAPICSGCWKSPTLRPSGISFVRHQDGNGDKCEGTPVFDVKGGDTKTGKLTTCPECGKQGAGLKTKPGKLAKHDDRNGEPCQQREGVNAKCPTCERRIGLMRGSFVSHNDLKTRERCAHTGRKPTDPVVETFAGARKTTVKEQEPKPKRAPAPKGIDAAFTKASIFRETIAKAGWQTEVKIDKAQLTATAVAKRGEEEITITWEEARCVGGTIYHTFRSRKIALRNKNAAVQRALTPAEQILAEHSRVSQRKRTAPKTPRGPRQTGARPKDEMEALRLALPFDPRTADQAEVARGIVGRTLTWRNRIADKEESGKVNGNRNAIRVALSKKDDSRQVTFFLEGSGAKTIRLADLISVA